MNHALTLRPAAPLRFGVVLMLCIAYLLMSAVSLAPSIVRSAATPADDHAKVCHCAHCPGGAHCCCAGNAHTCP